MKNNSSKFTTIGFLLFLIPLTVSISLGIVIYDLIQNKTQNLGLTAIFLLIYLIMVTFVFTFIDVIRRKQMIDKPVEQILKATKKIASGDFDVKLFPNNAYNKYDCYDTIMYNINKMASELAKSEILKKDFISNVSHEIKTPLSLMQNYAKLLANEKLDDKTKEKYLKNLNITINNLSHLVSNILKLNKLENQSIMETKEKVNIGELLRTCILQFEESLESKGLKLNCDIADIVYECDPSFFEIIYNNLISNAIKFTDKGKIDVSLKNEGRYIVLKVKDTGCGINNQVGAQIFEKFYQADTSHSAEGNGLGLALVKKIIDIMGGEITVNSQVNKGSTFMVKFKRVNNE